MWTGAVDTRGYGHLRFNGKVWRAHRLAFSLANLIELPERGDHSLVIMHSCDNRLCCNPKHLSAGTQRQNVIDCERKGRAVHKAGENNGRAKLTDGHVRAIRASKYGKVVLSRLYGVSPAQIQRIRSGKQWVTANEQARYQNDNRGR